MVTAEATAVTLGAAVVSNSWSADEFRNETSLDKYFAYPGVAVLVASGDGGYKAGTQYPAASPYVTAVGGTTLYLNSDNSYNSESAWGGAGSGCSAYEPKPDWQKAGVCGPNRTVADVAADADPATGAAVYNTTFTGTPKWFQLGGTSLATPIVAGVYALSGNLPPNIWASSLPYMRPGNLHDVISGTNGSCGGTNLCNAAPGFDGPTGLGTPNGTGGF
jgi:subtilase family serine protease